jgi:hypothetical protein
VVDTRWTNEIAPQDGHLGGAEKLGWKEAGGRLGASLEAAAETAPGRCSVPDDQGSQHSAIDGPPLKVSIIDSIDNSLKIFATQKK